MANEEEVAVILYGFGADLGNFRLFADDLLAELIRLKKFTRARVMIKETLSRAAFMDTLASIPSAFKIKELHVFSHSIGGGLYVGYHEPAAETVRRAAALHAEQKHTNITYDEVLNAEIGGILSDHLLRDPLLRDKNAMRTKFAAGAFMKLWGCNAGVSKWVYTDLDSTSRTLVSDQNATADYYYWRALNTRNVPKPSIAQALADYFGITVYGAGSGSHIEVQRGNEWITSNKYTKETGRWPGAPQTLRLHPDRGAYNAFKPKT
jgi:hypothetical protein